MKTAFMGGLAAGCLSTAGFINFVKFWEKGNDTQEHTIPRIDSGESERVQEVLSKGRPQGGRLLRMLQNHVLEYDCAAKIPVWVSQHLNSALLKGEANRQKSKFKMDPGIPAEFSAQNSDYVGSGWSRGHMSPAGDSKMFQSFMDETFYLSNILPQDLDNNAGFWNRLEIFCRDLTEQYKDVWVTSGPLFLPKVRDNGRKVVEYEVIGENDVAVPTHLYKVVVGRLDKDTTTALAAFIIPNAPLDYSHHLKDFQVPLEKLEKKAGLKFYSNLNREETRDLCAETGCNLLTKTEMDRIIYSSRLKKARTQDKLTKIWREVEKRGIAEDTKLRTLYQTRLSDLSSSEELGDACTEVKSKQKSNLSCHTEEPRGVSDAGVRSAVRG